MKKNITIKSSILFIALLLTPIVFSSCDAKRPAIGKEDEIYVIADSSEYVNMEGSLLTVFGKIIYTPQPEKLFELKRVGIEELERLKKYKNIIITAPLNSNSKVANYISSFLDSTVKNLVMSDSVSVINKYDLWRRNQLVMILTAPNMQKLNNEILEQHDNLLYYFQKISNKRLFESLYNPKYEKKKVEAKLLKDYGWIIYVQADFLMAVNNPDENFVWLRRAPDSNMERWIFVHWIDNASPEYLNPDSIAAVRNRITKKFYRTKDDSAYVEIADDYKTTTEKNFLDRYTLMTEGLWRMSDKSMGGPFINYTFYDENTRRLYMLDGSIYAPKYRKKSLIQQVDVILQSFMTEKDMSKEKKEDLLDELDE
jgi:uncharacterized protein YqgQ